MTLPTAHPLSTYRTVLLSLLVGAFLLISGSLLTGCDQDVVNDDGDNIIAPNTSRIAFEVTPGTPDTTQQLTLSYTSLSEPPRPEEVPEPFAIAVAEEDGSAADGSSTFDVTFSPPEDIGSFTERVIFRSGNQAVTIQLVGAVGFDDELVTDYAGAGVVDDFFGFNGIGASNVEGQLAMEGNDTGGPGQFPGVAHVLSETIDVTDTQVIVARMRVTEDSEGPALVRMALNTSAGPDANASIDPLIKEVPADGEYREYYFDFRDNFVQFDGQPADPSSVAEVVLLVNDGGSLDALGRSDTFTGTVFVDRLARRPDIPGEDDGGNAAPNARFSFSPSDPLVGETVTFTDESTDDGMIASRDWDFGDGSTGTGAAPTHTYDATGDYSVVLTVEDDEGVTATSTQTITVGDDTDDNGDTSDFRGDDDGDGRITFDDFEDGLQDDEYFTFEGGGAGIGLAESTDTPTDSDGTLALEASIDGGAGGGFAGFGKTDGVDVSDLGDDPYFTMFIKSDATEPFTLEINLQEDQSGSGSFDGDGPEDDEFRFDLVVEPEASGFARISVPFSAFEDDNSVNSGGDGVLSPRILNVVFAIGDLPGETFTLTIDDIIYSSEDLGTGGGDDDGGDDTTAFRGDDDGDGRITFDDFEDGLQDDEYFTFEGGGAGIGLAESTDTPTDSDGTLALEASIDGGAGGGFAGFGKGVASEVEVDGIDVSDLGSDPYLTMFIKSDATEPYELEINLQEDQDGNGTFDGDGLADDEFELTYLVEPGASDYTRISVPLSAFEDDNAVNSGGDGVLSSRIANLVFAIGNLPGEAFILTIDDIIYSSEDLGPDDSMVESACSTDDYALFFEDNFDAPDEEFWDRGDATFNGNLATFRPENITYEDGKMVLNLKKEQFGGKPYTGAELRTDNTDGFYSYGCYEVRMKSAGPSGTVSSFFAFRFNPWQEIDIEVVGKNNRSMLTNIFFNEGPEGASNNDAFEVPPFPEGVGLSYNASEEFHNYAFEWLPGEIKWYRDGQLVKQATVSGADPAQIPDIEMQIMMNLWVSSAPSFAGEIDDSNFPVRSEYDWVRFYEPRE